MHGQDVAAAMGVNTWAAFAGSDERAVVDGDFAMLESELQDVLKALRAAGISVVAIHHHMTHEEPRILFLHYWGVGPTADLAKGLRALDRRRGTLRNDRDEPVHAARAVALLPAARHDGFGGPVALVGYMQRDLVEEPALVHVGGIPARAWPWPSSLPGPWPRSSPCTWAGRAAGPRAPPWSASRSCSRRS